jgi:ABC-type lipoprotein release transport system permease subunit
VTRTPGLFRTAFFHSSIPRTTIVGYAASFTVGVAVAIAIVILASLGPALRAAGVQPAEAMRTD